MSAETARLASQHNKLGKPGGPGLFHDKSSQLPAYIQNVAKALERSGKPESQAIQIAIGTVKRWAAGGGSVSPEVRAAAAKAVAEWEALKAKARAKPNAGGGASLSNPYGEASRKKAAERGFAMPDGSYPIRSVDELHKAVQAYGRAKDKAAVKKHIIKRARELKAAGTIPQDWTNTPGFSVDLASSTEVTPGLGMIALEVPAGVVPPLPGGTPVDDMHVTLAFLGSDVTDAQLARAIMAAYDCAQSPVVSGTVGGLGVFPPDEDGKSAVYVPVDAPGLGALADRVSRLGASQHGFTPHITRGFITDGDKIPAPVDSNPVTFSQLIVKRGDQVFRFPMGGSDQDRAQSWSTVRAAAIELAAPAKQKPKKDAAPAKGDKQSAKFGEPDLPPGATHWKHGWVPVNDQGKPVGPAEKPKWLQDDEKKQLAAGGKTAQGYRDAAAAKEAQGKADSAKAKAKHIAAAAARLKAKAANALKSKKSKEAAAQKKAASARAKLVSEAYRQALADQKAGRKLTPQQQRVIGSVQAAQAKQAASLRSVDVPGAKPGKAAAAAPKAASKPLTAAQKAAAAKAKLRKEAAADRAKIAAARKIAAGSKYKITKLSNEAGDRVNAPFVIDLAGHRMPSGHLAFRFKHGWILINPAIPSRGRLGGGLAKQHGHKSGTVTHGHFEDHPSGKGKIFVADRTGGKLPSQKAAELKLKAASAPHTKSAYTTAAQGTPKPSGDALHPATPSPEDAKAKSKAASEASVHAKKTGTLADAQVAAKKQADAYVAQKKAGNPEMAEGHKKNATAWAQKAQQLKKAEAASKKAKADHEAAQKAQFEKEAKAKADAEAKKNAILDEQFALSKKADTASKLANASSSNGTAHIAAAEMHAKAAQHAEDNGLKHSAAGHTAKANEHLAKANEIADKKDEFHALSDKADKQSEAVEGVDVNAYLHNKIAAKHEAAAKLADEIGGSYSSMAQHHNEQAEHHKAMAKTAHEKAAAPKPPEPAPAPAPAAPASGPMSAYDAVGEVLFDGLPASGSQADWEDYLLAAQDVKAHPGSQAALKKMVAAKKKLTAAGVTSDDLQSANAKVADHMSPPKAAKKAAKKTVAAKKTAKKVAAKPTTASPKASDWDVSLTGPGMYKDGNKIKDLMAKPATSPEDEDLKRDAVDKALADFKAKHGKDFNINSVETFGDLSGSASTPKLDTSYFDDAEAAGYHHPDPGEDVTHGWKPPVSTRSALLGYTGEGGTSYVPINGMLRQAAGDEHHHAGSDSVRAAVKKMDKAFAAAPGLSQDTVTIRKMKNNGQFPGFPPPMSEGDEYTDFGYGSTSKSLTGWSGPVVMQVRMPKGLPVIDVNHNGVVSCSTSEQEVLIPRGARYRVVSDKMVGSQRQIITEVVGWGDTHPNVKGV